jgi:Domain of Unknown Function with PDB structure (DUF3857)/Transglutaminase-like superfamily
MAINPARHIVMACVAVAALLATPMAAFAKDSVPQWVKDAAAEKLPQYAPETDAVVLLEDQTLTVEGPGRSISHYRIAVRILRQQGRNFAHLGTWYDKDSKITSLKIWTLTADGREYQLPDNQISNTGAGSELLYDDEKRRGGIAMAADPGAVVAMEYEQQERPYVTEDIWEYQSSIPVHRTSYTLQLPPSFEFKDIWVRRDPVQPVSVGPNRWQWSLTDVPAIDVRNVTMHPSPAAMAQRMSIHYFGPGITTPFRGNWASVGEWSAMLSDSRLSPTPEIIAKAQELTAGKTGFYAKAEAIATFMQRNIRYVAIEIGVGGYQPHPAGDTFRNRYGDCKDKATLMLSMLGTIGIHGNLVMVDDRRGVVDPKSPSIYGNHMIAAIEVPADADTTQLFSIVKLADDKRYVIFDPTQPYIPFGQIPSYEQGSYGLLVDGSHSQIIPLPVLQPDRSTLSRTATFKLNDQGTLTGKVTEERSGDSAWIRRASFVSDDKRELDEWLDHHIRQDLSNFTVSDFTISNLQDLDKQLQLNYSITSTQYAKPMGSLLLLRPRVLGIDGPPIDHDPRHMPVDLESTRTEHDDYTIELPAGYSVDELPDPVALDLGFASYKSSTTVQANTLRYTRTLTVRDLELPAAQYSELIKMAGVIHADEQSRAVLRRGP